MISIAALAWTARLTKLDSRSFPVLSPCPEKSKEKARAPRETRCSARYLNHSRPAGPAPCGESALSFGRPAGRYWLQANVSPSVANVPFCMFDVIAGSALRDNWLTCASGASGDGRTSDREPCGCPALTLETSFFELI